MASSLTVLVVDDDDSVRQTVKLALEDEGYRVVEARNGRAGLDVLQVEQPAVILLDMRIPVLDGWGFMREYGSRPTRAPVVVFSAAVDVQASRDEVGADEAIAKPFGLADLLAVVERHATTR